MNPSRWRIAQEGGTQAEEFELLATRLEQMGKYGLALFGGTMVVTVAGAAQRFPHLTEHPAFMVGCLHALLPGVLVFSRRLAAGRSWRLRALELGIMVTTATFSTFLVQAVAHLRFVSEGGSQPQFAPYFHQQGMLVEAFMVSIGLLVRSALVPSTVRWTVTLGAVVALPVIGLVGLGLHPFPGIALPLTFQLRLAVGISGAVLMLIAVSAAAIMSSVVFSLRSEVRAARAYGQYVLGDLLGAGGMGTVYRATHALLRRPMAIKVLDKEKAGPRAVERFEREVQTAASLCHPNTITIYDYGRTPDGSVFCVMEFLQGMDLEDLVAKAGPLPPARAIAILEQMCGSLAEAHERGVVHRDVKPANVFLCRDVGTLPDFVKVLDFGLVREIDPTRLSATQEAGIVTGTPMYMAPEALTSPTKSDPRSDLYAVGAVAYRLITGQDLFDTQTILETMAAQMRDTPAPPSQRLGRPLPPDLEQIVVRCLAKDPDQRFQSAQDLATALRSCKDWGGWSPEDARDFWSSLAAPKIGGTSLAPHFGASSVDPNAQTQSVANGG